MKSKKLRSSTIYSLRSTIFLVPLALLGLNLLLLDALLIPRLLPGQPAVLAGTTTAKSTCPQACVTLINQSKTTAKTSTTKEYYIPLGQGTGKSGDWEDVAGVQATIDSSGYGTIKQATVETTVHIPTGNQTVWIRLVNSTDGRVIAGSELSMVGIGPTVLTTPAITLDGGSKLYKIQMKTQLKYPANVTQSRIRILAY